MKENKYDDPSFFNQYEKMLRSQLGLEGGRMARPEKYITGF
jgi:hypothetical protein